MVDVFATLIVAIVVAFVALAALAGLFGLIIVIGLILSGGLAAVRNFFGNDSESS